MIGRHRAGCAGLVLAAVGDHVGLSGLQSHLALAACAVGHPGDAVEMTSASALARKYYHTDLKYHRTVNKYSSTKAVEWVSLFCFKIENHSTMFSKYVFNYRGYDVQDANRTRVPRKNAKQLNLNWRQTLCCGRVDTRKKGDRCFIQPWRVRVCWPWRQEWRRRGPPMFRRRS